MRFITIANVKGGDIFHNVLAKRRPPKISAEEIFEYNWAVIIGLEITGNSLKKLVNYTFNSY